MSDNDMMVTTTSAYAVAQTEENTTAPFETPAKKRIRLTPAQREAKMATGWNPPGPRPKTSKPSAQKQPVEVRTVIGPSPADELLKSLVEKLIALENDDQYKGVWFHFFTHGGVYNGPNYTEELRAACDFLNGKR
jgi:hypothetical protein